jgi:CheY-like chemotaxis protein
MGDAKSGLCILVVEDDAVNRMVVGRLLAEIGHQVLEADSGEEVLGLLDSHAVDLILMDIELGAMTGLEVAKAIRAAGFGVPIVAMSAYSWHEVQPRIVDAGVDAFLPKPIMLDELRDILPRLLS